VVCFVAANAGGAAATAALRPEVPESKHRESRRGATGAQVARANHGRERWTSFSLQLLARSHH